VTGFSQHRAQPRRHPLRCTCRVRQNRAGAAAGWAETGPIRSSRRSGPCARTGRRPRTLGGARSPAQSSLWVSLGATGHRPWKTPDSYPQVVENLGDNGGCFQPHTALTGPDPVHRLWMAETSSSTRATGDDPSGERKMTPLAGPCMPSVASVPSSSAWHKILARGAHRPESWPSGSRRDNHGKSRGPRDELEMSGRVARSGTSGAVWDEWCGLARVARSGTGGAAREEWCGLGRVGISGRVRRSWDGPGPANRNRVRTGR
jgi:hypothetical protein